MRKTVYDLLTGQPSLTALVPQGRWYSPGAVLDNPTAGGLFVVLRWLAPVRSDSGRALHQLRVDVHDRRGTYKNIEQVLGSPDRVTGVYAVLSSVANHVGADARITQMDYLGHSGDQEDSTYLSNFKFSSWQVIGVDL